MDHLHPEAARELLHIVKVSYLLGLTSWDESIERLKALRAMCHQEDSAWHVADRILRLEEVRDRSEWPEGEWLGKSEAKKDTESILEENPQWHGSKDDEEPRFLRFHAAGNTGLAAWEFHPFDADPNPSVPHGHWHGDAQPKLDPYQGWVHDRNGITGREPRRKIIALWNERRFREFARDAISHYLTHFPHYGGWRVSNPARLPRRR
ncbi:hypothetical protein HI806_00975 [Ralstonia solanacearum]|uniref:hypothetical protein n=1 Tax=Ralstonia pseudosolanacearum TaxID=1310165 RepID=UPI000A836B9C|nr:hypothetical protein [Ralstonia pseudosolanacearum]NJZ67746.1 hypothetical protein [Ralstonia solanacearum]MCK4145187.1 hypothetical protein [Ralstonia pseudosolanacearum]NJZ77115.1 hypothetical protein [Ralstonia solanacearum]NKA89579.1 hypothetical protein [Ralstonia solanacearum]NKF78701.1 hypothetical protein [Ralstonia solanacearum]